MNVRYRVTLTDAERVALEALVAHGRRAVRVVKRAQILLAAAAGVADAAIAASVRTSPATVYRIKRAAVEEGLDAALEDAPRPGGARKLAPKEEALLVATACSAPPVGRARWTLALLADALVALTPHAALSRATVGRRLAENDLKPWREKRWCVPAVDTTYVARMEDVLDLYAEPADPARPVVCFDESPAPLIGEVAPPQPAVPGTPARVDFEYVRNGAVTLFVAYEIHRGWRDVTVTARRTAVDFAHQMKALVDVHYPAAARLRVVLDNLTTHTPAALYEAFAPAEARRLLRKLEFHYTPKHASWLNMVEIEIGVLKAQCLARRIPDRARLEHEIAAWQAARNAAGARIRWLFTTEQARTKLGRVYRPLADAQKEAIAHAAA